MQNNDNINTELKIKEKNMKDIIYSPEEDNRKVVIGLVASAKLIINIFISIMDFIPIKGALFSWSADAWKFIAPHVAKKLQAEYGINLDLTSGVSKKYAILTEGFELMTFGFFPTHALETYSWHKREGKQQIAEMREVFKRRSPKFLPD